MMLRKEVWLSFQVSIEDISINALEGPFSVICNGLICTKNIAGPGLIFALALFFVQ